MSLRAKPKVTAILFPLLCSLLLCSVLTLVLLGLFLQQQAPSRRGAVATAVIPSNLPVEVIPIPTPAGPGTLSVSVQDFTQDQHVVVIATSMSFSPVAHAAEALTYEQDLVASWLEYSTKSAVSTSTKALLIRQRAGLLADIRWKMRGNLAPSGIRVTGITVTDLQFCDQDGGNCVEARQGFSYLSPLRK